MYDVYSMQPIHLVPESFYIARAEIVEACFNNGTCVSRQVHCFVY